MDNLVVQLLDRVTELHENGAEEVTGVRTGYFDLDRMTAGFQPGDLIVLAANAIEQLTTAGQIVAGSRVDLSRGYRGGLRRKKRL